MQMMASVRSMPRLPGPLQGERNSYRKREPISNGVISNMARLDDDWPAGALGIAAPHVARANGARLPLRAGEREAGRRRRPIDAVVTAADVIPQPGIAACACIAKRPADDVSIVRIHGSPPYPQIARRGSRARGCIGQRLASMMVAALRPQMAPIAKAMMMAAMLWLLLVGDVRAHPDDGGLMAFVNRAYMAMEYRGQFCYQRQHPNHLDNHLVAPHPRRPRDCRRCVDTKLALGLCQRESG